MGLFDDLVNQFDKDAEDYIERCEAAWDEFKSMMSSVVYAEAEMAVRNAISSYYAEYTPTRYIREYTLYNGYTISKTSGTKFKLSVDFEGTNAVLHINTRDKGWHGGPCPFRRGYPPVFISGMTIDRMIDDAADYYSETEVEKYADPYMRMLCEKYNIGSFAGWR